MPRCSDVPLRQEPNRSSRQLTCFTAPALRASAIPTVTCGYCSRGRRTSILERWSVAGMRFCEPRAWYPCGSHLEWDADRWELVATHYAGREADLTRQRDCQ